MFRRPAMLLASFAFLALPLTAEDPAIDDADPIGRPKTYKAGSGKYAIWHDKDGWHFRATAKKNDQEFTGRIEAVDGKFISVKLVASGGKAPPAIATKSKSVDVSFKMLKGNESGFDLKLEESATAVTFSLKVDGKDAPEAILIGAKGMNPKTAEFSLPASPKKK